MGPALTAFTVCQGEQTEGLKLSIATWQIASNNNKHLLYIMLSILVAQMWSNAQEQLDWEVLAEGLVELSAVKVVSAAVIQRLHWADRSPPGRHSCWQICPGFWQEALVTLHKGLSMGCLSVPMAGACWIPEAGQNSTLYDVTLKVICHLLLDSISHTSMIHSGRRLATITWILGGEDHGNIGD